MPVPILSGVDQTTLTPVVRRALVNDAVEVVDWQVTPIVQGRASPAGVFRLTGRALVKGETQPWALYVKVLQSSELSANGGNRASDDPQEYFYWKRELLLFQSGLFDRLPNGFAAPRCLQIDEGAQEGRIWMEHVSEDVGAKWPLSQYGLAARHLGRFNGSFLTGEPVPDWSWLMKDVAHNRLEGSDWPEFLANYPTLRESDTLVQRGWDDRLVEGINRIWEDRYRFCDALALLPQTLNHFDAGRKNLLARRQEGGNMETVAVDWGSAGIGALGEELSIFVGQAIYWFSLEPKYTRELDQIAFEGYIQGLQDVGWQGDATLVRLAYTAGLAMRCGFSIIIVEWLARDAALRSWIEGAMGKPVEEIADIYRRFRHDVVTLGAEARDLLGAPAVVRYLQAQASRT